MSLQSQIESILFVASKALSAKQVAKAVQKHETEVEEVLLTLQAKYNHSESGINLLSEAGNWQFATNPENVEVVDLFIKDEASGELTKAQLETLTVIAYRGPITRPELEQIRGVNCAVIIRNLMMRGLVEEGEEENKILPVYTMSLEALRHLGINTCSELPDFDSLHKHEFIETALKEE